MIKKNSKKTKVKVTQKKLDFITAHIEELVELPISEYHDDSNNTDPFVLNTLLFILHFLLFLIPVLYYITYHNEKQVTCDDYSNSNGILFNNKTRSFDLFCKVGHEAKYTKRSLFGLYTKEKRCVALSKHKKQKDLYKMLLSSKKIFNDKAVNVKVAYSHLDSIAKDFLYQTFNEKHKNNPEKFKLKKINKYYMKMAKANDRFQSRKFRYSNKKSIFYKKPS